MQTFSCFYEQNLKNNPLFDEVIGYMEAYRHKLDQETEADYRELDAEAQAR